MRDLINPNLHAALIHAPIALLITGTLIELFSFCWRTSGFRTAGRWMILLGALLSIPTAAGGIYAFRDVASPTTGGQTWSQIVEKSPLNANQYELIEDHILHSSLASLLACLTVVTWIGCSDNYRRRLHWPLLAMLLLSVAIMTSGAWHGGEMVYANKIGVGTVASLATDSHGTLHTLKNSLHPKELHVIAAGFMIALSLAALGLSIRAISAETGSDTTEAAPQMDATVESSLADVRAAIGEPGTGSAIPSTRFWLLALLIGLAVIAAGLWAEHITNWHEFKAKNAKSGRILAHTIFGASIIVTILILTILSRWGKRSRLMLSIFAALLVLAVAGQTWIGTLLMFDTSRGSVMRFNTGTIPSTSPATLPATMPTGL